MKILQAMQYVLLVALINSPLTHAEVEPQDAESAVWIDVRSAAEFATGSIPNAHLVPFDGIEAGVQELGLSKDTPIYLFCRSGGRASLAKERLDHQGFTNVVNLGGLADARASEALISTLTASAARADSKRDTAPETDRATSSLPGEYSETQ